MERYKIYIALILLISTLTIPVYATQTQQENTTPLANHKARFVVHFPVNKTYIDHNFQNNSLAIAELNRFFATINISQIDSLTIQGSASPEGKAEQNAVLAANRALSLKEFLYRTGNITGRIPTIIRAQGDTWDEMIKLIKDDPNFPNKSQTLVVLSNKDILPNDKLMTIKYLQYDDAYNYLYKNILPGLRSASAVTIHYKTAEDFKSLANTQPEPLLEPLPEPEVLPYPVETTYYQNFYTYISGSQEPAYFADTLPPLIIRDTITRTVPLLVPVLGNRFYTSSAIPQAGRPVWAIKTNLAYWAALQPNAEVEFYFGKHWSLNFEYQVAWWKNDPKHQFYQYMHCGPEGRYYFKGDNNFRGHYVGVYVGFGLYDLSWGLEKQTYQGYQGEFAIALGLSYGYTWKIGKILHLEAGIGFGYVMTEYRRYKYIDECYVYQAAERMQFMGPTKLKIALQWRIGTGILSGKKNSKLR